MTLVTTEQSAGVMTITLDRPPVNALSFELLTELEDAIELAGDDAVRAVLISGAPHFAAGADISQFKASLDAGQTGAELGGDLSRVLVLLEELPKPVIAAVRGYALGGGLELAMGCDLRIMAEGARVGQPEIKLGVIPGAGGTQRLTRLVGVGRAKDLVFTGRMVEASEALAIGLADRVVPDDELESAAVAWATEIADGATAAIGIAKRVITDGWAMAMGDALALEAAGFAESFETDDAREGVAAFLEKRDPEFGGR